MRHGRVTAYLNKDRLSEEGWAKVRGMVTDVLLFCLDLYISMLSKWRVFRNPYLFFTITYSLRRWTINPEYPPAGTMGKDVLNLLGNLRGQHWSWGPREAGPHFQEGVTESVARKHARGVKRKDSAASYLGSLGAHGSHVLRTNTAVWWAFSQGELCQGCVWYVLEIHKGYLECKGPQI